MTSLTNFFSVAGGVLLFLLKLVGFVLLGLVVLLVVALFIPISVDFLYEHAKLKVMLRAFGFKFRIIDPERKKKEKPAEQKAEEAKTEQAPEKKVRHFDFELIRGILEPSRRAVRIVFKKMRVTDIDIVIVVSGGDPEQIGVATGRTWAALGSAMTLLNLILGSVQYERLDVIPDFMAEHKGEGRVGCKLTAFPIVFVAAAIIVFRGYRTGRKASLKLKPVANSES